jgi:hypothetical protein
MQPQPESFQSQTTPPHEFSVIGNHEDQKDSSSVGNTYSAQAGSASTSSCDHLDFQGLNSPPELDKSRAMPSISERRLASASNSLEDSCESDCAGIAMALQQQLEAAHERPAFLSGQMDARGADAAMEIVSSAFRQLSTILICPCSERLEVGLLVAAACISILDVYGVIISSSAVRPLSQSGMSTSTMTMEDDAMQWNMMDLSGSNSCKLFIEDFEEDVLLVRVMSELSKMATVVMQFTKRYRGNPDEGDSSELLYAVATYLRNRLQTIKDETTGRLL